MITYERIHLLRDVEHRSIQRIADDLGLNFRTVKKYLEMSREEFEEFTNSICKKQVFDQQFSEKLISADFGKLVLHIVIDKAVMRQRAAASLLGA